MFENHGERKLRKWGKPCPDCEDSSHIYIIMKTEKRNNVSFDVKYLKCYSCEYEELKENKNRKNKKYEYDFESDE